MSRNYWLSVVESKKSEVKAPKYGEDLLPVLSHGRRQKRKKRGRKGKREGEVERERETDREKERRKDKCPLIKKPFPQ
jgi:hypothetical protein